MSTPTPRTDAALLSSDCAYNCGHSFKLLILEKYDRGQCVYTGPDIAHGNDGVVVLAEFARALERELTAERARLDWLLSYDGVDWILSAHKNRKLFEGESDNRALLEAAMKEGAQ